ncbi:MAG: TIGR00725 family protein [Halanaeroarchaeum sp.]
MRVSVIGGGTVTDEEYAVARGVGETLAVRGHTVVCGGLTGVMEAVAAGTAEGGGRTIGILPGEDVGAANEFVDVPIATGLGNARNVLVVLNGQAAVAIDGATGTLSELGHALDLGRPVAGIGTHDVEGVEHVETATEAVDYVESAVSEG